MADNKLREINIKNCTYYYLDGLITINDLDFENLTFKSNADIFNYYLG